MTERLERRARNESMIRAVNEQIERLDREVAHSDQDLFDFHCECGRPECDDKASMRIDEYEHVRQQSDWFVLVPGHETPELERVVERRDRYIIVDKVPAAEPYVDDDPRGAPSR